MAFTLVAVALGMVWAVSPIALVAGAALTVVCGLGTASLDPAERLRVRVVLCVAIGLRLLVLAGVFATTPASVQTHALFPDSHDLLERSMWLRNLWLGVPVGPLQVMDIFSPVGASSFVTFLAVLQIPTGSAPFGLSLLCMAIYVAGVLAMFHVVREGFGSMAALTGLAALLFWPSLLAWSLSVLKEPVQMSLTSLVVAGAASVVQNGAVRRRALGFAAAAGALALLTTLRAGGMEIAAGGIAVAMVLRLVAWRRWVLAVLLVLAVAGGWRERDRVGSAVRLAASRHIGHVKTAGVGYRLLDERYYRDTANEIEAMTLRDGVAFLAASVLAFVTVPLPWQVGSRGTLALLPLQLAWYVACAAAIAGFVVGSRRAPWLTAMLAGTVISGWLIIAPNSGNVGTLIRHRDLVLPFVLWLGGLGVVGLTETARASAASERPVA